MRELDCILILLCIEDPLVSRSGVAFTPRSESRVRPLTVIRVSPKNYFLGGQFFTMELLYQLSYVGKALVYHT